MRDRLYTYKDGPRAERVKHEGTRLVGATLSFSTQQTSDEPWADIVPRWHNVAVSDHFTCDIFKHGHDE